MTDPRFSNTRTPPYSLDAEQAVLGALMLSDEAYFRISDKVNPGDFYRQDHRIIFQAIASLKEKGQPCDAVTLGEWLERTEQAEAAGGIVLASIAHSSRPAEQQQQRLDKSKPTKAARSARSLPRTPSPQAPLFNYATR